MNEPTLRAIETSLRRQFEPPCLDALTDRVTALAAQMEEHGQAVAEPGLHLVDPQADQPGDEGSHETSDSSPRRFGLGVIATVAAAAALVLWLAQPDASDRGDGATAASRGHSGSKVASATSSEVAGQQLDAFLRFGAYNFAPAPDADCVADQPPLAAADLDLGAPTLPQSPEHRVLWECGGWSGVDCSAHDLPAQRLMVVELMPSKKPVIVCIEPPWADPQPELPADSRFNIFRRTLGDYVLYEITPLDEPHALGRVTI